MKPDWVWLRCNIGKGKKDRRQTVSQKASKPTMK